MIAVPFPLRPEVESLETHALLTRALTEWFPGRIALVSSFGIESAVLLHLVAGIAPATPVLFLETGKLFGETLRYRDTLIQALGLSDVRTLRPDPTAVAAVDGDGMLWQRDADACCRVRKVEPLGEALAGFDAWINGRKRHHGGTRAALPQGEQDIDGKIKFNPLARWSRADLDAYAARHALPAHPLAEEGFASVGCYTCSTRAEAGENARDGRWRGQAKTECGIHRPAGRC